MMAKHEKRGPKARGSRGGVERIRGVTALRARRDEKRGGNAAPWKAWKTEKPSFPRFPPGLEIRPKNKGAGFPHFHRADGGIYICLGRSKEKPKPGPNFS
jgi:hypothetical protein